MITLELVILHHAGRYITTHKNILNILIAIKIFRRYFYSSRRYFEQLVEPTSALPNILPAFAQYFLRAVDCREHLIRNIFHFIQYSFQYLLRHEKERVASPNVELKASSEMEENM